MCVSRTWSIRTFGDLTSGELPGIRKVDELVIP